MGSADLAKLSYRPRQEAIDMLANMKSEAKRRFQDLAVELHPDHNPGDSEAGKRLSSLVEVRDWLMGLEIGNASRPGDPPPMTYQQRQDEWVEEARAMRKESRERAEAKRRQDDVSFTVRMVYGTGTGGIGFSFYTGGI